MANWKDDLKKPDFAGDLRERLARSIYTRRPDCFGKPWPVETAEQKRVYPHAPIAAVDLSYDCADVMLRFMFENPSDVLEQMRVWLCESLNMMHTVDGRPDEFNALSNAKNEIENAVTNLCIAEEVRARHKP